MANIVISDLSLELEDLHEQQKEAIKGGTSLKLFAVYSFETLRVAAGGYDTP